MAFYNSPDEVYEYIGGVFRTASADAELGPTLAAADIDLQIYYSDPDCKVLVKMHEPKVEVIDGGENDDADVKLFMPADIADKYWRGEYNLAVGLARGQVKAKGPITKILKLVPLTKTLFPMYRDSVAGKDAGGAMA